MSQYVYATLPKEGSLMVVIMYINVITIYCLNNVILDRFWYYCNLKRGVSTHQLVLLGYKTLFITEPLGQNQWLVHLCLHMSWTVKIIQIACFHPSLGVSVVYFPLVWLSVGVSYLLWVYLWLMLLVIHNQSGCEVLGWAVCSISIANLGFITWNNKLNWHFY